MALGLEHYYALGLLVFFLAKGLLVRKSGFINEYNLYLNIGAFALIAVFLGFQFWQDELYTGILALVLGTLAMGKYFLDMEREGSGEEDQDHQ